MNYLPDLGDLDVADEKIAIPEAIQPQGVAVVIQAQHGCMTGRGAKTHGVDMVTSRMLGCFLDDADSRREVLSLIDGG